VWKDREDMEVGVHLPLMEFGDEGQSPARLYAATDAARDGGFAALAANDHFLFATPWLDGLTALAAVIDRSDGLDLATTIALASLRGPVPLAKALAAVDLLSGGRLIAGVGPGSSRADYEAVGVDFDDRWPRFEAAVVALRALLRGNSSPLAPDPFPIPAEPLSPPPARRGGVPIWIGSWGSAAGLRRVARLGDGWLASAYNTTPARFREARGWLAEELARAGRDPAMPAALATMWTWVTESRADADRVMADVLAPLLRRDPAELRSQVCVGGAAHCLELLGAYGEAGCDRVYVWPLGDEARQLELLASQVLPELREATLQAGRDSNHAG
jgi:alkanesulfonate monooxygenase SsuD/methylene tetrahydromethanopterin reductase-like flavin-dependent oxidoreductase (luciferase family)